MKKMEYSYKEITIGEAMNHLLNDTRIYADYNPNHEKARVSFMDTFGNIYFAEHENYRSWPQTKLYLRVPAQPEMMRYEVTFQYKDQNTYTVGIPACKFIDLVHHLEAGFYEMDNIVNIKRLDP